MIEFFGEFISAILVCLGIAAVMVAGLGVIATVVNFLGA